MEQKHKGSLSELLACAWLLSQGYEVFRNVSAHGPADIVAVKNDEFLMIDVKTTFKKNNAAGESVTYCTRASYDKPNIKILGVDLTDNSCFWMIHGKKP